jgi:hypothetical protein
MRSSFFNVIVVTMVFGVFWQSRVSIAEKSLGTSLSWVAMVGFLRTVWISRAASNALSQVSIITFTVEVNQDRVAECGKEYGSLQTMEESTTNLRCRFHVGKVPYEHELCLKLRGFGIRVRSMHVLGVGCCGG